MIKILFYENVCAMSSACPWFQARTSSLIVLSDVGVDFLDGGRRFSAGFLFSLVSSGGFELLGFFELRRALLTQLTQRY
jgi:hypothetical protein